MTKVFRFLGLACFAAAAVLAIVIFVSMLTGCQSVTDPATGKTTTVFNPSLGRQITEDPGVKALLGLVPLGLGTLGLSATGMFFRAMEKKTSASTHESAHDAIVEVSKHAITSLTEALNASEPVPNTAMPAPPKS
jgi:hypothetical protein